MKKKFMVVFLTSLMVVLTPLYGYSETVRVVGNKDYSTSGEEDYDFEVTEDQQQAREEAKKAYSSEIADKSINIKPLFDSWTTRQAQAKVNNIGNKLLLANDIDDFVRFSVSRKEVVNAYANNRGEIKVFKGLLEYVETEDELAYVLGHELGHIYKKDVRTGMIRQGVAIGTMITGVVLAAASNNQATKNTGGGLLIAGAGGLAANQQFTKAQESRADLNGIDFMVKAGYNPLAAISMMNKILNRNWDIFSDHPSGDKRMVWAYDHIEKNYPLYTKGGYDTISYQRALKYIMNERTKRQAKITAKENRKSERAARKINNKKEKLKKEQKSKDEEL